MAPKRNGIELLFHPKPKKHVPNSPRPPLVASSSTQPSKQSHSDKEDEEMKVPEGPFSEFTLVSSALNGWKYDVMKFDSRKHVDITSWAQPLKLNRKELKRVAPVDSTTADRYIGATPMKGLDGKEVVRADGSQVMLDKEGRVIPAEGYVPPPKTGQGRKRIQKKTRQVYIIPDEQRQLKKDERYPWILEDASKKEVWVGRMDDAERSDTQAFFMPAMNNSFKFVPSHRWYKFQKRPNYYVPTLEEAEDIMAKQQKDKDPHAWLLRNRKGQAPSAATTAIFKAESEGRVMSAGSSSLVHSSGGQSMAFGANGSRKLKSVDKSGGSDLFGDDDTSEGGSRRRIKREEGADGDFDEQVYQSEHSDDEEDNPEEKDDEGKEIEERLKREYQRANKVKEGDVDESDEEPEELSLTKDGKAMKKLLTGLERNTMYDSDEDKNPYASSDEEEEEEEDEKPIAQPDAVVKILVNGGNASAETPSKISAPRPTISSNNSRATSPNIRGGHSLVAQRATSPKSLKIKSVNGVRSSSPLGQNSRSASPTSPSGSRSGSPALSQSNKRKAADDSGAIITSTSASGVPSKPKKRKAATSSGILTPSRQFEDSMLIQWLATTPNPTTRDCVNYFKPYTTDDASRKRFIELVKTVASQKNGVLTLKDAYRNGTGSS